MRDKGEHLGIYHVGTTEEIAIAALATLMAAHAGREIALRPQPAPAGGTARRCPDIGKLARARLCAAGAARQGPAADHRLVLGEREPCAASLI